MISAGATEFLSHALLHTVIFDIRGTYSVCLKHTVYASYAKVRQRMLFLLLLWHVLR